MKVSLQGVTHSVSRKVLIPAAIAASTLLGSISANAQNQQTDTLKIANKELVSEPTRKGMKLLDISMGIAFLLGMGAMAASKFITNELSKNDNESSKNNDEIE